MQVVETTIVSAGKLKEISQAVFVAAGLSLDHAVIVANSLVEADLRGVHSHGIIRMAQYLPQLVARAINPSPTVQMVRDSGTTALIDGDAGMGQVVGSIAMEQAIEKASAFGVGIVTVRNSSHFGMAGYFAGMALDCDMIGFAATNCRPCMAAPGGTQRRVGNNPLAYAIPSGTEWPVLLDMAQSVVAVGKLRLAAAEGQTIPLGWALDSAGCPTDDPNVGAAGLMLPIGGPKGYGLAVVMDVLCAVLSGADFGVHIGYQRDPSRHENAGHFFMALQIERFVALEEFKARVDQMVSEIHASKRAPGVERLYLPGEIEWELRKQRLVGGIPLSSSVVAQIRDAAKQVNVACDL